MGAHKQAEDDEQEGDDVGRNLGEPTEAGEHVGSDDDDRRHHQQAELGVPTAAPHAQSWAWPASARAPSPST